MNVIDLTPPVPSPLPQCEAQRSGRHCLEWEERHPDKTCKRKARYKIDGRHLCSLHAGEYVLSELTGGAK